MYMKPNLYLVPQPGSIFKFETEAIIKESPRQVFSRKKSMKDYKELLRGKRDYDNNSNAEQEDVPLFQRSDSVMQLDVNVYIRDPSSRGSQLIKPVFSPHRRNHSTLEHTVKVNNKRGLELMLDDCKDNMIHARRNSEL